MKARSGWAVLMAALVAAACCGCGGKADKTGTLKAGGRVTYKGEPVSGATVTLVPQARGRAAVGTTDDSGRFQLTTLSPGDGALPGTYKVTVTKTDQPATSTPAPPMDSEAWRKLDTEMMKKAGKPSPPPKDLLPVKYKTADKTPLTCQVETSGKNDFQFDLTD